MALLIAGARLGTLVQMLPSVHVGTVMSPRPAWYLTLWLLSAVVAVVVSIGVLVRGRGPGPVAAALDVAFVCLLLVLGPLIVSPDRRLGTWVSFAPGYALSVLITVVGVRSLTQWILSVAAVVVSYAVYVGGALDGGAIFAVVGNILTYVFAGVGRLVLNYIRRIAADADESRARAAELARREEETRARVVMHDGVALMRWLIDPDISEPMRQRLHGHFAVELNRMRAYLRSEHEADPQRVASWQSLDALVRRVTARFTDLPIELLLDLGADIEVDGQQADAIEHALASLLINVREHARADQVIVHLDSDAGRWALTVSDDGVGFDTGLQHAGIGLREIVVGQLARVGIDVHLDSAPTDGTMVTMRGQHAAREEFA